MHRRSFVRTLAGVLACLALPSRGALGRQPDVPAAELTARRLVRSLRRRRNAAALGRAYLKRRPEEAQLAVLVERITHRWPRTTSGRRLASRATLRRRLRDQVRHDFAHSRTVAVEGWVLAESEARLFALAALMAA